MRFRGPFQFLISFDSYDSVPFNQQVNLVENKNILSFAFLGHREQIQGFVPQDLP